MQRLVEEAREARTDAVAPYSGFAVGAALRTSDGAVYQGCNIEIANFSNSLHAEEVALAHAVKDGKTDFEALAVSTRDGATPCGMCRQSLSEFDDGTLAIVVDDGESWNEHRLGDLLPEAFGGDSFL